MSAYGVPGKPHVEPWANELSYRMGYSMKLREGDLRTIIDWALVAVLVVGLMVIVPAVEG